MNTRWKIALLLLIALLIVVPAYAQDTTPEATATEQAAPETHPVAGVAETTEQETGNVNGLTTGVLLVGLAVIGVMGLIVLTRENYKPPTDEQH